MGIPRLEWVETAGFEHTGEALREIERLIAGHAYEIAGGEVRKNRQTQEISARVYVCPALQAGMQATRPWEKKTTVESIEEGRRWCERNLTEHIATYRITEIRRGDHVVSPEVCIHASEEHYC